MRHILRTAAFVLIASALSLAEGTQIWTQSRYDELQKGTAKGIAIRSDGTLELAPAFKALATTPSTYIWSLASDKDGNVYAATGSPARVYRITPAGQITVVFQPQELQVQSLIADGKGGLFAATSPDGKVYRIERTGKEPKEKKKKEEKEEEKTAATEAQTPEAARSTPVDPSFTSSVYFDPKTKYIWDLALDVEGRLYVATGDRGEIFRVSKAGEGSVFFKSDEAHIRVLAFDTKGNLIAGSDGSGLVYRISPAGEGFVLYSAPKKEITALALDPAGNIYAAAVGEKRAQPGAAPGFTPPPQPQPQPQATATSGGTVTIGVQTQTAAPPVSFAAMSGAPGGAEVYMIAPDGAPRRIWSSREDLVYSLTFDQRGQLLAGTGNRGHIFALRTNGEFTDLGKFSASQITGFAPAPGGGLYCSTSNLGKIFAIGAQPEPEGTYDSDVFDAKVFSKWGRAEVRGSGHYEIYARSGNVDNPDRNWSPWRRADLEKDVPLDVPQARFVQWRAVLRPGPTPASVEYVSVNYRPNNVAPVVDDVYAQVGARFNSMPRPSGDNQPVTVGPPASQQQTPRFEPSASAVRDRESIAVRWTAHDDNDDQMVYAIYYRGDGETEWKLLKDKLNDKHYSWDAGLLPDGGYNVRIIASDAPSHSPEEALTNAKESSRFEVDRTPPAVADLNARIEGGQLHLTFRATDGFSPIKRAEYSVDAGEWQFVEPIGQLSDSKIENYDFDAPAPRLEARAAEERASRGGNSNSTPAPEHVVVVRVYDRYDNMGTAKLVFREGAGKK